MSINYIEKAIENNFIFGIRSVFRFILRWGERRSDKNSILSDKKIEYTIR